MTLQYARSLACCVAMSGAAAHAATVGLHLGTHHLGPGAAQMSDANPGVYFRAENGFTAGVYRNSHRDTSAYVAWTVETPGQMFAVTAGVVTGYRSNVSPLLVPSMRIPVGDFAARLAYIPKPPRFGGAAGVHLSIERNFE